LNDVIFTLVTISVTPFTKPSRSASVKWVLLDLPRRAQD
jgi:hypothetical protein